MVAIVTAKQQGLKIVLVEDSPLLRQLICSMIEELDGVHVVGHAEDERSALEVMAQKQPDLAIVDLELRGGSGIGVLRALSTEPERYGSPQAVVFSNHAHASVRARCEALGVGAFFDKSFQMDELIEYIQSAAAAAPH
ncbi:MAG: response regulator transcription factor [Rhodocyclaceae bacterium]|nr:response regulator transcription factor [Rhodocyclaceae bacterium]